MRFVVEEADERSKSGKKLWWIIDTASGQPIAECDDMDWTEAVTKTMNENPP